MLDRLEARVEISGDIFDVWWLYWDVLRMGSPMDQGIPLTNIEAALRMAGWL